jgi:2-dehydro-3-deoxy-D-arabinonate dehydratase
MKLAQIRDPALGLRVGLVRDGDVYDLTQADPEAAASMLSLLNTSAEAPMRQVVEELASRLDGPTWRYQDVNRAPGDGAHLTVPIQAPEVWAAGVTYERSRTAREEESLGYSLLYSKVYEADRPELFNKTSNMLRVAGPPSRSGSATTPPGRPPSPSWPW